MWIKRLLILLPLVLFCASQSKNYRLSTLSDPQPKDEHAVIVLVNLRSDSGNTVAVFNWGKYQAFNIYRAESPLDSFRLLGILNAGPQGSSLSLLPFFHDAETSSPDNRYRVNPLMGTDELMQLPVLYETPEKACYLKIEKPNRTTQLLHSLLGN